MNKYMTQKGLLALPIGLLDIQLKKFPKRSGRSSRISKRLQKEMPSQRERHPPRALNKLPSFNRINWMSHCPCCPADLNTVINLVLNFSFVQWCVVNIDLDQILRCSLFINSVRASCSVLENVKEQFDVRCLLLVWPKILVIKDFHAHLVLLAWPCDWRHSSRESFFQTGRFARTVSAPIVELVHYSFNCFIIRTWES